MPRWTEESRRRQSDLMRAMPRSQEWKDNVSRAKRGVSVVYQSELESRHY